MEWYDKVTPKTIKSVKGTLTDWDKKELAIERKLDNIKLVKTRAYIENVMENKMEN